MKNLLTNIHAKIALGLGLCLAATGLASAATVFSDNFNYSASTVADFQARGWTAGSMGTGMGTGTSGGTPDLWGNNCWLEYDGTNVVSQGDIITMDATLDPTRLSYPYIRQIILTNAGVATIVAAVTNSSGPAILPTLAYVAQAADAGKTVIYHYGHGPNWGQTFTVTFGYTALPPAVSSVWTNAAGGSWPVALNWSNNAVAAGLGTADFSQLALTFQPSVTLDGNQTIGNLIFGDLSNANGWSLDAGSGGNLTLVGSAPGIAVNNQTTTISAVLAGTAGFTKTGPGTLSLTGINTYTGPTTISAGTLSIGDPGQLGGGNYGGVITNNGVLDYSSSASQTLAGAVSGSGALTLNGSGTLTLTVANSYSGGSTVNAGTLQLRPSTVQGQGLGTGPVTLNSGGLYFQVKANTSGNYIYTNNLTVNGGTLTSEDGYTHLAGGVNFTAGATLVRWWGGASAYKGLSFDGVVSGSSGVVLTMQAGNTGGSESAPIGFFNNGNTFGGTIVNNAGVGNGSALVVGGATALQYATIDIEGSSSGKSLSNRGLYFYPGVTNPVIGALTGTGNIVLQNSTNSALMTNAFVLAMGNNNADSSYSGGLSGSGSLVKIGTGAQTFTGANTFTGSTTVSNGTLLINGSTTASNILVRGGTLLVNGSTSVSGAVTTTGGLLAGRGTIGGSVAVNSGGTLGAGDANGVGTLTLNGALTTAAGGTNWLRLSKSGSTLTNDLIVNVAGITYGGALTVTASGDPLAAGDSFKLFSTTGTYGGSFAVLNLPALSGGLMWDTSALGVNGSIAVINASQVSAPLFSPAAGGYLNTVSVTISSTTAGATIHYTTDGSDPTTSGTAVSGASPVTGVVVPANTVETIKAYATAPASLASAVSSAVYGTINNPAWLNPVGGSWPVAANWSNNVVADGVGVSANFSQLTLAGDATVTLDGAHTVGSMSFGDAGALYNWNLTAGSGGTLTLANGASAPAIAVGNQTATVSTAVTSTNGLVKNGNGALVLSGSGDLSGNLAINGGALTVGGAVALHDLNTNIYTGTIANNGALVFSNSAGAQYVESLISGTGGVTQAGTVALYMMGTNTYSGVTAIQSSYLEVHNGPLNIVNSVLNVTSADTRAVDIWAGKLTVRGLTGTGQIASNGSYNQGGGWWWNSNPIGLSINVPTGESYSFGGVLKNGTWNAATAKLTVEKTGPGTEIFTGANTNTGGTLINGGTLQVDGSLGAGTAAVGAGGILTGNGTVAGPVVVGSGGTLAPGTNGAPYYTAFTLSGAVTLNSGGTNAFVIDVTNFTSTLIAAGSGVTFGGTLRVTALGDSTSLTSGSTFTLFTFGAGAPSGSFAALALPPLASGLTWDLSGLYSSGVIKVSATLPAPVFLPPAGGYASPQTVALSANPGATILYSTDSGTTYQVYTAPLPLPANTAAYAIQAYATNTGFADSPVAYATYSTTPVPTWLVDYDDAWSDAAAWSNSVVPNASGAMADFSTVTLTGGRTVTLATPETVGGLRFADRGNAFGWTLANGGSGALNLNNGASAPVVTVSNQTVAIGVVVTGTNGLVKAGGGLLAISNSVPTYTGSTIVNAGVLRLNFPDSGSFATASITVNTNGALDMITPDALHYTVGVGALTINGGVVTQSVTGVRQTLMNSVDMTGGTLTSAGAGDSHGNYSFFGGAGINATSDATGNPATVSANAISIQESTLPLNVTRGPANPVSDLTINSTIALFTTYNGGLLKTGNGIATLNGVNTYNNATVVSNGTLVVNGSLAPASTVTVAGGTLSGTGTIQGPTVVQSGAQLTPGATTPGTLTFTNALTLAAGSTTTLRINNAGASDAAAGMTGVTLGGTLTVTNVGGALALGNSFQLFSATSYSGNFSATNLPALGSGLAWNWNPANGTLSVASSSGVNTNPTNIVFSVSGGQVTLAWPADHTGWTLQVQTNALNAGLTTNWTDVPGSTATNQMSFPVNPANPTVFYRLKY